jgi:hypothetical protein
MPFIQLVRTVTPGICEVRDVQTHRSYLYRGTAGPQYQFIPTTTPDGEWIEAHLEHGETEAF